MACLLLAILHAGGLDAQPIRNAPLTAGAAHSPGARQPTATPQQPQLVLPVGETGLINSAVFTPDGSGIIVSSNENAKLWETATGRQLNEIDETDQAFEPPSFTPDGKYLLVPRVGAVDVWDATDGHRVDSIADHYNLFASASFSPDGKLIEVAWWHGKLGIYQAQTGKLLRSWQVVDSPSAKDQYTWYTPVMQASFFSPDGKKIFYNGGGAPAIIDAMTGKQLVRLAIRPYEELPYTHFQYSPDGKTLLQFPGADNTGKAWSALDGRLLFSFGDPKDLVRSANVSPDHSRLLVLSFTGTLRIVSMTNGRQLLTLPPDSSTIIDAEYSPDGKVMITTRQNGTVILRNALTGAITRILPAPNSAVNFTVFNPAAQLLATISDNNSISIWDIRRGQRVSEIKGHTPSVSQALFTPDKKTVFTLTDKGNYRWNPATGHMLGRDSIAGKASARCWDSAGDRLVTIPARDWAEVWNAKTGQALTVLRGHTDTILSASFSLDGTKVVTAAGDSTARIWDAASGVCLFTLRGHRAAVLDAAFSPDGSLIATGSNDSSVRVWSAATGRLLLDLRKHQYYVTGVEFSPDGSTLLSNSFDGTAKLWDAKNGSLQQDFGAKNHSVMSASFSPDGSKIFLDAGERAAIWYAADQHWSILDLDEKITFPGMGIQSAKFSADSKKLVISDSDSLFIYDAGSGRRLAGTWAPLGYGRTVAFGPDARTILACGLDNSFKIIDARTARTLYRAISVDSADYLIYDQYGRYDGSDGAKKLLYFTCGTEIISLDQVKDQLWVPNLAYRLLAGESINASRLSDLAICGLMPVVETKPADAQAWHFIIHPRSGGLGSVVVSVNGNETRRYSAAQLPHTANGYSLMIPKKELAGWLVPGQDNPVTVKAYTAQGELSSRGAVVTSGVDLTHHPAPNLYAVMVGISDYKGKSLHLRYAAKDASDLSLAIGAAARSWLDQDGNEHVFMYNLTTDSDRYLLPEKAAIRQTFDSIAKKATAADILLIFFAGHGVMGGDAKKHFYFLTADAADASGGSAVATVGISTQELSDWIHPSKIRAQKRILILDACNSGQVIKDLVTFGTKDHPYHAARNDDNAEQIRSIDKLNERSGLFILAASASDQSAYEQSRYSHGLLTYALLKAIREDPAILDASRYLNVSPWFDHAEKMVSDLALDIGGRQDPQLVSTASFNIGIVDSGVIASIKLRDDRTAAFSSGSFLNTDTAVGGDDLQLTTAVAQQLLALAARGDNYSNGSSDVIDYTPSDMPGAWSLHGFYTVSGDQVNLNVNLWRNNQNLDRFRVTGATTDIKTLAATIIGKALDWIKTHS